MSRIKNMAVMTFIEYDDGMPEVVITSHPDGNVLEDMCKQTVNLINALIVESRKDVK